jgi:hypothetical protein
MILFFLILLSLPLLYELYRFGTWQYNRYQIIKSIYVAKPPTSPSKSTDAIERLQAYLEQDQYLTHQGTPNFNRDVQNYSLDCNLASIGKKSWILIRFSKGLIPSTEEIKNFSADINTLIKMKQKKPSYIRAIILSDWRNEEGDIPDELVKALYDYPIRLARGPGGGPAVTYVQLIFDQGTMYSMIPLVPDVPLDASS